nr:putative metal-binding protein [uncultured archaeon]ARX76947.1 putative metal-binding protein [uncultured archaeon]
MSGQEVQVIFQPMNRVLSVLAGTPLLDALRTAGILIESICGGKGLCRKCRVILTKGSCASVPLVGASHLTAEERAQGYYFACQVTLTADAEFTLPVESRIDSPQILISSVMQIEHHIPSVMRYPVEIVPAEGLPFASHSVRLIGYTGHRPRMSVAIYKALNTPNEHRVATLSTVHSPPEIIAVEPAQDIHPLYGVAIDLGTTTVVGCLVDLATGEIVGSGSTLNRQITYGEELITRIGYSDTPEGLSTMHRAAVESVDTVISQLVRDSGIEKSDIMDMCVAGNTVMNHLFCNIDPRYLELANAPVARTPIIRTATTLALLLHPSASVYCLPNVSRFVGGDAIGDVIASGMHESEDLSLLVDLGTNGEIILGNRDWMASVSCASGPAFEGAGITSGMRAMKGAIEHVRIDPVTAAVTFTTIGDVPPRGICGSGIIDTAAAMVLSGILDFAGKLRAEHPHVRSCTGELEYVLVPKDRSATGRDIVITQPDIDYLMDSKAAACGAIGVLLKKYRVQESDIRHVYLAGAFGAYTDIKNAVRFGIIPEFSNALFHPIGNGSLSGAYATLVSREHRTVAETVAKKMVYIDLLVDTDFIEEYSAALYIPGKKELFPAYFRDNP